jgi:hypothetical protein
LFIEPGTSSGQVHKGVILGGLHGKPDALTIDIGIFCEDILTGAEQWLDEVEGTEPYESNYARFMKRHPEGLPPYITGVSVVS